MNKHYLLVIFLSFRIKHILTLQTTPRDSAHVRTWSKWYDTDTPTSGNGDDESVATIRKRGYEVCDGHSPIDAMCRLTANHMLVFNSDNTRFIPDTLVMPCTTLGLKCRNMDQSVACRNYQIRFECLTPNSGETPENLGVIGAAAGLSVIVPIFCVVLMHIARYIRDSRRPASQTLVDNTEQSVQTDTSDLPPSYSFLFGSSDTSTPTGVTNTVSLTDSSGDLNLPNSRISSNNLLGMAEEQTGNSSIQNVSDCDVTDSTSTENLTSSNWRSRFPNMHLSIFDLFSSMGQRSPSISPQSLDLSYIQTPPPTYKDAIVIISEQNVRPASDDNEKPDS